MFIEINGKIYNLDRYEYIGVVKKDSPIVNRIAFYRDHKEVDHAAVDDPGSILRCISDKVCVMGAEG
jgi:hypothetical protein